LFYTFFGNFWTSLRGIYNENDDVLMAIRLETVMWLKKLRDIVSLHYFDSDEREEQNYIGL